MEKKKFALADVVAYAVVILMLIWTIFPLYWLFITAFHPLEEFMTYPPTFWPTQWTLDNFTGVLVRQHGLAALWDSLVITLGTLIVRAVRRRAGGLPAYRTHRTGGDNLSFTILSFRGHARHRAGRGALSDR